MTSRIKMRENTQMKVRGGHTKVNSKQMIFELKHKVVIALNKLADRDTYQIGFDELEKTVEHLTPDRISSFLSCILDTDSEQKSVVRKECIRLIGTVARFHEGLVGPYLLKMVSSIVKRLKDPDSIVRDACVDTMGVLASRLSGYEDQNSGVFIALVKPLFEALGEQNKHMQSGSALCLARVIDSTPNVPVSILQRMLTRTVKLLNNPHFMAKPAVIELNRSIIQAGGATTKNCLSAAMTGFQQALKGTDWTTRKAASVALTEIASSGGSFLGSLKTSCLRSLESCRFDRVKPVRDSVLIALQHWRNVPGSDSSELSEAESSFKGSFCGAGEGNELISTGDSGWKDAASKKPELAKKKLPLSTRKTSKHYAEESLQSKQDDWHVEIAVPKPKNGSMVESCNEESEGSCLTKMFERKATNFASMQEVTYEYVSMDDKPESCSLTNLGIVDDDPKSVTVSSTTPQGGNLIKQGVKNHQFAAHEVDSEEQPYLNNIRDRRSLDSTVTVSSSQVGPDCCAQMVDDMASLRKQLSEIENKQSNLLDHLQAFSTGIMNSLSMLQSKVQSLEYVVDGIAQNLVEDRRYSESSNSKPMKQSRSILSPRLSTSTSRPSIDIRNRKPSLLAGKNTEKSARGTSRLNELPKQNVEMWANTGAKIGPKHTENCTWNSSTPPAAQTMNQLRKNFLPSDSSPIKDQLFLDRRNGLRKNVKSSLSDSELDLEYVEVLSSGDELALVELLDRTGPVLDSLSPATLNELIRIIVLYLLERRFMTSIIPWLQQVVELSSIRGPNYLVLSPKTRCEILSAVQEASTMECSSLAERRSVNQLAIKLRQLWGKS